MDERDVEAFWKSHDPVTNQHAETLLSELSDRRKQHLDTMETIQKASLFSLLVFWVLALQQGTDLTFAGVTFSNPKSLLILIMAVLSYCLHSSIVLALHLFAINKALSSYYSVYLPAASKLRLPELISGIRDEGTLGEIGMLNKWSAMLMGFLQPFGLFMIFLLLNLLTIFWVSAKVSLPEWDGIRIFVIVLSSGISIRAIWIFFEFMRVELLRKAALQGVPGLISIRGGWLVIKLIMLMAKFRFINKVKRGSGSHPQRTGQ